MYNYDIPDNILESNGTDGYAKMNDNIYGPDYEYYGHY